MPTHTIDYPRVKPTHRPTRCERQTFALFRVAAGALCRISLLLGLIPLAFAQEAPSALEEIVVTATLIGEPSAPISASVLTERSHRLRGAAHFEDLVTLVPNLTSSSGASRNRFFQIRGIGERSQFVEPVNPSVGILLDGIDLSGAGGALTLYDLSQAEVLRGPQGTLMGANALAGLIALKSQGTDSQINTASVGIENYGGRRLGIRTGGSLSANLRGRIAIQHYESDGYVDNHWLNRSDTNARDEITARGALTWEGSNHSIEAAVYYTDLNNGYDAFSLDNTRWTLSDQPGEDDLRLKAGRINWQTTLANLDSVLQVSHASTDTVYGYDEDWSYVGIAPGWEYSSYDEYARDRTMNSLEWRLQSTEPGGRDWVIGTYLRDESERLTRQYTYLSSPFNSDIDTQTTALFGQINQHLGGRLAGFVGARLERRDSEYGDNAGVDKDFDHNYWTGRLGLIWRYEVDSQLYVTMSRGARAGGANAGLLASVAALPPQNQDAVSALGVFQEETLLSAELGWQAHWPTRGLRSRLAVFAMDRDDQQAKGSLVIPRADGSTAFIDYTDNAAASRYTGLEWEAQWQPLPLWLVEMNLGVLSAHFDDYVSATGEDLSGRDQPQAPSWQYLIAASWRPSGLFSARVEMVGHDAYFFSDRHDVRSVETHQLNASVSGEWGQWRWTLWGRNLTDDTTFVRGFGTFGNDPRKEYALEPYRQFGEPRIVGLTLSYSLSGENQ
ncbi:MAG: TonB-dependent receptor [Halieaceae bacterium]